MSAFEDFVNLELPKRAVTIKGSIATGDPNLSSLPEVNFAPVGSMYFQEDIVPRKNWAKLGPEADDWSVVGEGAGDIYSPLDLRDWASPAPSTIAGALDRLGSVRPTIFYYVESDACPYATIQDCVDAAALVATVEQPSLAIIASGTFSQDVELKDNVILQGQGKESTTINGQVSFTTDWASAIIKSLSIVTEALDDKVSLYVQSANWIQLSLLSVDIYQWSNTRQAVIGDTGADITFLDDCYIVGVSATPSIPVVDLQNGAWIGLVANVAIGLSNSTPGVFAVRIDGGFFGIGPTGNCVIDGSVELLNFAFMSSAIKITLNEYVASRSPLVLRNGSIAQFYGQLVMFGQGTYDVVGDAGTEFRYHAISGSSLSKVDPNVSITDLPSVFSFVPSVPADWDSLPKSISDALNELASRVRALEP